MERRARRRSRELSRTGASTAAARRARPIVTDPTRRFSSRVDHYLRYRPSYPRAAIDLLVARCGLARGAVVADIGAGTGILTELLLERGAQVLAVEPNEGMRAAAEARLGARAGFRSVNATAEATTLTSANIDLLVAAQAFHWFDVDAARREALRILKVGGCAALLWNERPAAVSDFLADYDALLQRHAPEYLKISASRADLASMQRFFGAEPERATFPNEQILDFEGLCGRLNSSSYAPEPGHPHYEPMTGELREVFERHAQRGRVAFPYATLVYFGVLRAAG